MSVTSGRELVKYIVVNPYNWIPCSYENAALYVRTWKDVGMKTRCRCLVKGPEHPACGMSFPPQDLFTCCAGETLPIRGPGLHLAHLSVSKAWNRVSLSQLLPVNHPSSSGQGMNGGMFHFPQGGLALALQVYCSPSALYNSLR